MKLEIQVTTTISLAATDYKEVLKPEQKEWNAQNLGIMLEQESDFTKANFEKALKRVSRKTKK